MLDRRIRSCRRCPHIRIIPAPFQHRTQSRSLRGSLTTAALRLQRPPMQRHDVSDCVGLDAELLQNTSLRLCGVGYWLDTELLQNTSLSALLLQNRAVSQASETVRLRNRRSSAASAGQPVGRMLGFGLAGAAPSSLAGAAPRNRQRVRICRLRPLAMPRACCHAQSS
jgi:hypothetical protein